MRALPFSIATDGSNDYHNGKKYFPLVVRVNTLEGVETCLLSLCICHGSGTGANIFKLIDTEFAAHSIPWSHCISLGSDNAPVMTGKKSGVISFAREKNPTIFMSVNIAARKGASELAPIEEALVDVFYYFKRSAWRQSELQEFQELYNVENKKVLKHVSTRWLSIKRCVDRLLHNWDPIRAFFQQEGEKKQSSLTAGKAKNLLEFFRSPTNKLFAHFLFYLVKTFDPVLVALQAERPLIHKLRPAVEDLVKSLMSKLVESGKILGQDNFKVDYKNGQNPKKDEDLSIGTEAMMFIAEGEKNHLRPKRLTDLYSGVRRCYEVVLDYLMVNLPWEEDLLKAISIVDVTNQLSARLADFLYLLRRFPCLVKDDSSLDDYLNMFELYKCSDVSQNIKPQLDQTWSAIGKNNPGLQRLADCMKSLLTIPHSSAACERVFSMVRKNLTDQRSSLHDSTLEGLLVLKSKDSDFVEECQKMDRETFLKLKSACSSQLQLD